MTGHDDSTINIVVAIIIIIIIIIITVTYISQNFYLQDGGKNQLP